MFDDVTMDVTYSTEFRARKYERNENDNKCPPVHFYRFNISDIEEKKCQFNVYIIASNTTGTTSYIKSPNIKNPKF